jgi:bile acid:Na+ symporter, BASS family
VKLVIDVMTPLFTFLLLTAVGSDLTRQDFAELRRRPRFVGIGLVAPLLVLPLVAVALLRAFDPPLALAAGLFLIAACPVGGISNTYSYLARASTALSVMLTGFSCLLAWVTIPLMARVFQAAQGRPFAFAAPLGLLVPQMVAMLALPVGLGMWARHRWPAVVARHRALVQRLGFGGLALLVLTVMWAEFDRFVSGLATAVPVSALFVVASFAVGWLAGVIAGADRKTRFTLAAVFATRNVAVATAIAVTLLHQVEFAVFATTYFVTELPLMLLGIVAFRVGERGPTDTPR